MKLVRQTNGHKVDAAYLQKNRDLVIMQLKYGGMLLAACLERLFDKVSNVPVEQATSAQNNTSMTQIKNNKESIWPALKQAIKNIFTLFELIFALFF